MSTSTITETIDDEYRDTDDDRSTAKGVVICTMIAVGFWSGVVGLAYALWG